MDKNGKRTELLPEGGESGWTFMETLIVLGIVLILTATVGFMFSKYLERAKEVAARSQVETLALALHTYVLDCGDYPSEGQGLAALWKKPMLSPVPKDWRGPYLTRELPSDPWGRPYEYRKPGPEGMPFSVTSYGADGAPGGEGPDADLSSW